MMGLIGMALGIGGTVIAVLNHNDLAVIYGLNWIVWAMVAANNESR